MVHLKISGTLGDDAKDGWDRDLGQHVLVCKCRGRQLKISRQMSRNVECIRVVPSKVRLLVGSQMSSGGSICTKLGVKEPQKALQPFHLMLH